MEGVEPRVHSGNQSTDGGVVASRAGNAERDTSLGQRWRNCNIRRRQNWCHLWRGVSSVNGVDCNGNDVRDVMQEGVVLLYGRRRLFNLGFRLESWAVLIERDQQSIVH